MFYFKQVYTLQIGDKGNVFALKLSRLSPGPYKSWIFMPHLGLTSEAEGVRAENVLLAIRQKLCAPGMTESCKK